MKTSTIVGILIGIVVIAGVWYVFSQQIAPVAESTPAPSATEETTQQPVGDGTSISDNLALGTSGNVKLGTYLIAYNGMTLYTTSKDTGSVSNCYDTCAKNWPPYIVSPAERINLQSGVGGTASTTTRTDGTLQLTYNGKPLYFYVGDKLGSDALGQGSGGVWTVVKP